jgi:hypothetical protein
MFCGFIHGYFCKESSAWFVAVRVPAHVSLTVYRLNKRMAAHGAVVSGAVHVRSGVGDDQWRGGRADRGAVHPRFHLQEDAAGLHRPDRNRQRHAGVGCAPAC